MLFNLTSKNHFPNKKTGKEIRLDCDNGPCFSGGDYWELSTFGEPFNGDGKCVSCANEPGYGIPVDGAGINQLTKKKGARFTISEIEVWEVIYID
jgi:hypothetical protein